MTGRAVWSPRPTPTPKPPPHFQWRYPPYHSSAHAYWRWKCSVVLGQGFGLMLLLFKRMECGCWPRERESWWFFFLLCGGRQVWSNLRYEGEAVDVEGGGEIEMERGSREVSLSSVQPSLATYFTQTHTHTHTHAHPAEKGRCNTSTSLCIDSIALTHSSFTVEGRKRLTWLEGL